MHPDEIENEFDENSEDQLEELNFFSEVADEYEEVEEEAAEESIETYREDKIFNNRYNVGDGLTDSEDYSFSRKITIASDYSDSYLRDIYDYEEVLEYRFIIESLFSFIQNDPEISKITSRSDQTTSGRSKFNKEEVNFIFNKINEDAELSLKATAFYSPIYVLEIISAISSIEYKKLFDMLDTDVQEILILELNKKYQFLDGKMHKKRIH